MGENEESTSSEKVLILPLSEDSKKITQLLSNEKAMKMLEILADRPMSASDVAEKLDLPLTTVKYNLDGLVEADLIKVKETKWSRKGREVKIYEPVHKLIVVAPGSMKNDRSSIISMLKKYLGLIAGAVFAATGLEALSRYSMFSSAPQMAQDSEVMTKAMPEFEADDFAGYEDIPDTNASDTVLYAQTTTEEMPVDTLTESADIPTESADMTSIPSDGVQPEMFASAAPNGTDAGADMMRESALAVNQTQVAPMSNTVTDNVTAAGGAVSDTFMHGLLSHVSVWFFFGCIFVITILFVREMYYRKKNI
ncbi:helix-turn-helix domain-containing protein [Methanolobus sediminis]|uniref:Helix-turn-helix domain-containing protein n=1 Tax=Methanolobus sediminis TaxID=3072978 RepID=A0AA51UKD6_9EURY|nr:helix-turn-helix domain-containing protein [Methanolobus sediminis]WMW23941.1 helix-turn-helix domain-containing protein [Methanolobus sediminis]